MTQDHLRNLEQDSLNKISGLCHSPARFIQLLLRFLPSFLRPFKQRSCTMKWKAAITTRISCPMTGRQKTNMKRSQDWIIITWFRQWTYNNVHNSHKCQVSFSFVCLILTLRPFDVKNNNIQFTQAVFDIHGRIHKKWGLSLTWQQFCPSSSSLVVQKAVVGIWSHIYINMRTHSHTSKLITFCWKSDIIISSLL